MGRRALSSVGALAGQYPRRVDAVMIDGPRVGGSSLPDGVSDGQRLMTGGLTPDNLAEAIARVHP